jgi:hypothetical protein
MSKTKLEERMFAYVESAGDAEKGKFTNYALNVNTLNGPLGLKFWNMRKRDSFPVSGDFVELKMIDIDEATAELDKYKTLSLDSTSNKPYFCELVPVNEEDVPEEVRRKIKKDRTKHKAYVLEMLRDGSCWKDKRKHEFLLGFFKSEAERFTTAPAATDHHHNYKGGLFIHTGDVFSLCKGVVDAPMNALDEGWVDSDVLYMAAWFHDAGKMDVYKMEGDSPKIDSDMERRVGHPTISNQMFTKAAQDFGLSSEFITAVSHCILSHHDRKEWGAVVEPDTIEAKILCRADYISSRKPD